MTRFRCWLGLGFWLRLRLRDDEGVHGAIVRTEGAVDVVAVFGGGGFLFDVLPVEGLWFD